MVGESESVYRGERGGTLSLSSLSFHSAVDAALHPGGLVNRCATQRCRGRWRKEGAATIIASEGGLS